MPGLELIKTVCASARGLSTGVVVGVLVERNLVARVRVAEDITATAAMVTTNKVIEGALAFEVVTDG